MSGKSYSIVHGWKFALSFIAFAISIGLTIWMISLYFVQKQEIQTLQASINSIIANTHENPQQTIESSDKVLLDYYTVLSNKADVSIDRVITITAILFGVSTASGLWFTFRAPKDIEKSISCAEQKISEMEARIDSAKQSLEVQVVQAHDSAKEAAVAATNALRYAENTTFEFRLHDAKEERNSIEKNALLTSLIELYPDRYQPYYFRSSNNIKDKKTAIADLELAKERGLDEDMYFNLLGLIYQSREPLIKSSSRAAT